MSKLKWNAFCLAIAAAALVSYQNFGATPAHAKSHKAHKAQDAAGPQICPEGGDKIDREGPSAYKCPDGQVLSGICVKAGSAVGGGNSGPGAFGIGAGDPGTGPGCYVYSELGGPEGSVSGGGTENDCKNISHSSYYCEPGKVTTTTVSTTTTGKQTTTTSKATTTTSKATTTSSSKTTTSTPKTTTTWIVG
jgi:hypothetical protein